MQRGTCAGGFRNMRLERLRAGSEESIARPSPAPSVAHVIFFSKASPFTPISRALQLNGPMPVESASGPHQTNGSARVTSVDRVTPDLLEAAVVGAVASIEHAHTMVLHGAARFLRTRDTAAHNRAAAEALGCLCKSRRREKPPGGWPVGRASFCVRHVSTLGYAALRSRMFFTDVAYHCPPRAV
jgi:hypothetical protein